MARDSSFAIHERLDDSQRQSWLRAYGIFFIEKTEKRFKNYKRRI